MSRGEAYVAFGGVVFFVGLGIFALFELDARYDRWRRRRRAARRGGVVSDFRRPS